MNTHTRTHTHIYMYTYIHAYTYVHACIHTYFEYPNEVLRNAPSIRMHARAHVCAPVCTYFMSACAHVLMWPYGSAFWQYKPENLNERLANAPSVNLSLVEEIYDAAERGDTHKILEYFQVRLHDFFMYLCDIFPCMYS
jgi:hypothetical protein